MDIRNIAIIAHVDHGKTTLVDALLRQSDTKLSKEKAQQNCIMDSNELERERGITIFSKNASIIWKNTKINIIDTPGHADFGGEVERVLQMADASLLLIDSQDGPMPQTRFVLQKALELKHKIIVVINKIDQPNSNITEALNKTFDLFIDLGADDKTANFPIIYASAKDAKAGLTPDLNSMANIHPLFEQILKNVPAASGDINKPLQILVTSIYRDNFKGRIAKGRIYNGNLSCQQEVVHINLKGEQKKYRLTSLMTYHGLEPKVTSQAQMGEIVAIAGIPNITVGETITDPLNPQVLPALKIEEPTVKMTFSVNTSPFGAKEATYSTSSQIRERLLKELDNDVALKIEDKGEKGWIVSGRGELHLAILIERLRREGYAFQVSPPQVIKKQVNGKTLVPYDEVFLTIPEEFSGNIIQSLGSRYGEMKKMDTKNNFVYLDYLIPTQGLFGYRPLFLSETKGLGIINTSFYGYLPEKTAFKERSFGSLVAFETGITRLYGLTNVQDQGELFVGPGTPVYKGQVVGRHSRQGDLRVNVCKEKKLSNMRSKGEGVSRHFNAPKTIDLDFSLAYITSDELVDVSPKAIRMRKEIL